DLTGREALGAVELIDARPVGDDETGEAELAFQNLGDQVVVAVELLAVEAAERDHDRADAELDRSLERRQVDGPELRLADARVALIGTGVGTAVADVVLGGGEDRPTLRTQHLALISADDPRHRHYQVRVFGERLVGAAPAVVARHAQARREGPGRAGGGE